MTSQNGPEAKVEDFAGTKDTERNEALLGTGLSIWHGRVTEEYLNELKFWQKTFNVYRQMQDDAVIGAMMEAIKTPMMAAPFEVRAADDSDEAQSAADFLQKDLFNNHTFPWGEHIDDMLEFLDFGFALAEKVMEKRSDGKIHIATLLPVGQETLYEWGELDDLGRPKSFKQRVVRETFVREAPMEKLLHFTFRPRKRDPMGKSLFRSLYRPWYFKSNLEVIEAIGAERDVGNVPIATLGPGFYTTAELTALKDTLEGLRMDESSYLILPNELKIEAYRSSSKAYNLRAIIRDWQHTIRQRFFADFLALGSENIGSQALAREMTTFFGAALRSIQRRMLEVWNRQLIPYLFDFNGLPEDKRPVLAWLNPARRNLQTLAQAYQVLIANNLLTPDPTIERMIRIELDLPPISDELLQRNAELALRKQEAGLGNQGIQPGAVGTETQPAPEPSPQEPPPGGPSGSPIS